MTDEGSSDPVTEDEKPIKSSIISWKDVYRVQTCGDCHKANCPQCTRGFLSYLNRQGTRPQQPGGM